MRAWIAFWIPVVIVLGFGFTVTALAFPPETPGGALAPALFGLSVILSAFITPVLFQFEWWVLATVMVVTFRLVRVTPSAPAV